MDWLKNLISFNGQESVGALLVSSFVIIFGSYFWKTLSHRIRHSSSSEMNLLATIDRAVLVPGYALILFLGMFLGVALWPEFSLQESWLVTLKLLLSFSGILFFGEAIFAFGIDFYLRTRKNMIVPKIFNQLAKTIIYIIVGLSFLSTTYKIDITPLLTTSAIFTMIIGLALQDVLGNLFSGLSVHISPPFKTGDWIRIQGYTGKVVESNWRATTLKTILNESVTLPNNDIAKKEIINLSPVSSTLGQELEIGLSYSTSPFDGSNALRQSCAQIEEILENPSPQVFMESFADYSIIYRLRYWIQDFTDAPSIRNKLTSRIWYKLKRENITVPFPVQEINIHPEKDLTDQIVEKRLEILGQVDFLEPLTRVHRAFLATNLREEWYGPGEIIVRKGDIGSDFYIIDQGKVSVILNEADQKVIAVLEPKAFFGEMSLLTGEPRSASIRANQETRLLILEKQTFSRLLHENAEIAQKISDALAERQRKLEASRSLHSTQSTDSSSPKDSSCQIPQASSVILNRIKRFFSLR